MLEEILEEKMKGLLDAELFELYQDKLEGDKQGMRPQKFDEYARLVMEFMAERDSKIGIYNAYEMVLKVFYDEIARRYFTTFKYM